MKKLLCLAVLGFSLTSAQAATDQQSLVGTCNKEAADRQGKVRKAFVKKCVSDATKKERQKQKKCDHEARGKKGDERNRVIYDCLREP
ncbi:MAG: PsiF repeat protein [Ramlibacter sp.]|nr:PsiF repeat protein [Ramlibacter sp.]